MSWKTIEIQERKVKYHRSINETTLGTEIAWIVIRRRLLENETHIYDILISGANWLDGEYGITADRSCRAIHRAECFLEVNDYVRY